MYKTVYSDTNSINAASSIIIEVARNLLGAGRALPEAVTHLHLLHHFHSPTPQDLIDDGASWRMGDIVFHAEPGVSASSGFYCHGAYFLRFIALCPTKQAAISWGHIIIVQYIPSSNDTAINKRHGVIMRPGTTLYFLGRILHIYSPYFLIY